MTSIELSDGFRLGPFDFSDARSKLFEISSFVLPAIIYLLTLNAGGGQSENIVSMQSSMLQTHSLNVLPYGMDMIRIGGKLYNVYAPGLAFLSFPLATLGFVSFGVLNGYVGNAILMDEVFLSICASLSGYVVYKTCQLFSKSNYANLLASIALTLGSSVWPFAVSVFPHDASLLFSLVGVYLVLRSTKTKSKSCYTMLVAGVSLGIATLVEYAAGLFVLPLILYVLLSQKPSGKYGRIEPLVSFLGSFAIVGIGLNLIYNYAIVGNPIEFPQQLYGSGAQFALDLSFLEHILYYLFSPFRGLFVLCPILILGLFGLREMLKRNRNESILFVSLFVTVLIFYSAWQGWDGAWAYGPRFLILGMPYLAIPICILFSQNRSWRIPYAVLFTVSSVIEGIGAIAGASSPGRNDPMLFQSLSYALPKLLSGSTSVFWIQWFGYPALLVDIALVFSIISIFLLSVVKFQPTTLRKPSDPVFVEKLIKSS